MTEIDLELGLNLNLFIIFIMLESLFTNIQISIPK